MKQWAIITYKHGISKGLRCSFKADQERHQSKFGRILNERYQLITLQHVYIKHLVFALNYLSKDDILLLINSISSTLDNLGDKQNKIPSTMLFTIYYVSSFCACLEIN